MDTKAQYLEAVSVAVEQLAAALNDHRGSEVGYAQISDKLPPHVKARVCVAALSEHVNTGALQGAFGFGRFLAESLRAPFRVFDMPRSHSNVLEMLEPLLLMQEGACVAFQHGSGDYRNLFHAHAMLRGLIFEATREAEEVAVPSGSQSWAHRQPEILVPPKQLLSKLYASCAEVDSLLKVGSCDSDLVTSDATCSAVLNRLKEQASRRLKTLSPLLQRVHESTSYSGDYGCC